jgi:16S rRNA processing protein RimM
LRVEVITGHPERLGSRKYVYLASQQRPEYAVRHAVERIRLNRNIMLLKLAGCDDRNAAEEMRGLLVQIPLSEAVPLDEDEYYEFQLVGLTVETDDGETLGRVVEVLETKANDVYVIRGLRGEVLLPAIADVVLTVDLDAGRMLVHLLPGLLEEEQP